jgi:hypothetical protein
MLRKLLIGAALIAASATANAVILVSEGFDDISTLGANGFTLTNNSSPAGVESWHQGNSGVFPAFSGAADSFLGANYLSAEPGGNVDNWLITAVFTIPDTNTFLDFYTRTAGTLPGDNLGVYYNTTGSTNLADYVLFGDVVAAAGGTYPADWTGFRASFGNLQGMSVSFALRYTVTDTNLNGDYIGIDSLSVSSVPEPGTFALLFACLLMIPIMRRQRARA